jgi:hypothetical protein
MNIKILLQSILIGLIVITFAVFTAIFVDRIVLVWIAGIIAFLSVVYAAYIILSNLADK